MYRSRLKNGSFPCMIKYQNGKMRYKRMTGFEIWRVDMLFMS